MNTELIVLSTLIVYKLIMIVIGFWANKRTQDNRDFFLAGGHLGPWISAISASASSSSAWTLLGVSGAAYLWGIGAIWLFPAVMLGFLVNWLWVAPRLYRLSKEKSYLTLTGVVCEDNNPVMQRWLIRLASIITLVCFIFYIASQFDAAGKTFVTTFGVNREMSIMIGASIIVFYTLMGGFWAVSVTDTLQGLMMAFTAILLPAVAVYHVIDMGGYSLFMERLMSAGEFAWTAGYSGAMGVAFVLGTLGIGLGYPGQPHVVNRFMAIRDERTLKQARVIALTWAVIIYTGMILLGWCARVLVSEASYASQQEQILVILANELFHPMVAGVILASVLSAIMSTADSQLLVASASVSHDLGLSNRSTGYRLDALLISRLTVAGLSLLAVLLAVGVEQSIYDRVLFAWSAIGASFGPLLVVRLMGKEPSGAYKLAAMLLGFSLTLVFF